MPFDYEFLNVYNGMRSPTGTVEYDLTTAYFYRNLYQRALSVMSFTLPKGWNKRYFKNVLFSEGFIGIVRTAQFGIVPQICTFSGYGLYLQPTHLIVTQPLVQFEGDIGIDCSLFRLTPDFKGILDIVEHYALQMSKCYTSINVSLVNSRLSMIGYGKTKAGAEALKWIAEQISKGETIVFPDKAIKDEDMTGDSVFTTAFDPAKNYITDKLLNDLNTILNSFDREIGIPIIDSKKERMLDREISTLISDAGTRLTTWIECLNESIEDVKEVFPEIEISFKTRLDEKKEGGNENGQNDSNRVIQ